jgi:succinyl-diaminopimelate desuccinylase
MEVDLNLIVESYRKEIVSSTQELVAIPSVKGEAHPGKPFGKDAYSALEYVLKLGDKMGFETKNVDGYAGHIQFGQGEHTLGILVHLDVVPAGGGWTYPPYGAEIHDRRIYGRGTIDNKGPAIAALYAMEAVKQSGLPVNKNVRLIFGTDEESGWKDMEYYFKHESMPDFGMSPDAQYPIINAEKGILQVALEKEFPRSEPHSIGIKSITGGQRPNIVPDECTCVFLSSTDREKALAHLKSFQRYTGYKMTADFDSKEGLIVKSIGVSAHGSAPETGKNAIGQMLEYLATLGLGHTEMEEFISLLNNKIGMETHGEAIGIALEDKLSGKLTLNLGMVKIDGGSGRAVMDIRYPVSCEGEQLLTAIEAAVCEFGVKVKVLGHRKPLYVPEDHFLVQILKRVYTKQTGQPAYTIAIGGGTYARVIENAVAFGVIFPGKPELAHQKDEYVEIEDLILNTKIYAHAIAELVQSADLTL